MQKYSPLFLFLQEHWLPNHDACTKLKSDFTTHNFLTTSDDMFTPAEDLVLETGPVWQGTAIGWSMEIDKFVCKLPVISDRFCGVQYTDVQTDTQFLAYTLYLPTAGKDEEFLEVLSSLSADIAHNNNNNSAVVIGCDSNQSSKSTKRRSSAMNNFLAEFGLESILIDDKPTFHHNNQTSETKIDHIYHNFSMHSAAKISMHNHLCLKENPSNLSSHDVIVGKINLPHIPLSKVEKDFSSTYTPFLVKKPKWCEAGMAEYQAQTFQVLQNLFNRFDQVEHIPALTEMCSKMLVLSAEQNFETTNPSNEDKKKKKYPYFSKAHRDAYKEHEIICKKWRSAGRPKEISHPAKAEKLASQRRLQKIARESASSVARAQHDELMGTYNSNMSQVCSKLNQIRGQKSKSIEIPFIETLCGKFEGQNVLEGFCSNTEILCNEKPSTTRNEFYEMCVRDNIVIFEITASEKINIPKMELKDLKDIIFKRLKLKKACDIYKLTLEHLRYCGDETLSLILQLLNSIIDNLNYLSSPQLNTSVTSIVHKGKDKPIYHHKSYRQVRVTPLIGRLLDEFMRPSSVQKTRPYQSINQYGFSEGITYLMGALQRHETEKYCIDMKMTFFGCSLDGESAFEVVDRAIQTRELYCSGLNGQYWQASNYSYQNSLSRVKMKGNLSRSIQEKAGVKQGHINSSDHYKVYINPALEALDESKLGVWIGPINVSGTGVADDLYLTADTQSKLQALLEIASHYGYRYKIKYGASKTKITVVGSKIDMDFYSDTTPWIMDGEKVKVVEDNDHLGQIVSGTKQEMKNVDERISKGRRSIFALLGPAFSQKCLLSPLLKIHLYRTYACPIIRSGLSSFALSSAQLGPLTILHRKKLKSFLSLSKTAATPAIHFILGELPLEGKIHRDVFSLFFSVWTNPDTKIYQIVKYLLEMASENSHTWCAHIRFLSQKYNMWDPLSCLSRDPPTKSEYSEYVATKITAYFEQELRKLALKNSLMTYLNVNLQGLRGKPHPALKNITTTEEALKCRPHLKMLCGNLLTYEVKFNQSGTGSAKCRLCNSECESLSHIVANCSHFEDIRSRIFAEYENLLRKSGNNLNFSNYLIDDKTTTQFILDPTSFNLRLRINICDPIVPEVFKLSRDLCCAINKKRTKSLQSKLEEQRQTCKKSAK